MSKLQQLVSVTIVIMLLLVILPSLAQTDADVPEEGNVVLPESIYVRSGPAETYVPVGALFAGDEVFPFSRSEDALWILIRYNRGFGWVDRNLIYWQDYNGLDLLPVLSADQTPTPAIPATATAFFPTYTPDANYVNVVDAESAFVRAGPGRTYIRLGQLLPGDVVEPVARNENGSWILIRYQDPFIEDGFAWIARTLVVWQDIDTLSNLPVMSEDALTPTMTYTPSITPSQTNTLTMTYTPTQTLTATATSSFTPEPSETFTTFPTDTSAPTLTHTPEPSNTPEPTLTHTPEPSNTPEPTLTHTPEPSNTPEPTLTYTPEPSNTPEPTLTNTPEPTDTHTPEPTQANTATEAAVAVIPTDAPTLTNTPIQPTATPTEQAILLPETSVPLTPTVEPLIETPEDSGATIPAEAILGGIILLIVLIYIFFYWQGLVAAGRYQDGFVIEHCPVCEQGQLQLDEKPTRLLGIPRVRRLVRCDNCRSVLREIQPGKWRYAVDRAANSTLFERFNGKEIADEQLRRIAQHPSHTSQPLRPTPPEFVDNSGEDEEG